MKLIDKAALVAEIKRRLKFVEKRLKKNNSYSEEGNAAWERDKALYDAYNSLLSFLDTLEVKEVVVEQEGVCNGIFNRIIGDNWNLSIPLDKVGLKHGDKVKIFVTKENKL